MGQPHGGLRNRQPRCATHVMVGPAIDLGASEPGCAAGIVASASRNRHHRNLPALADALIGKTILEMLDFGAEKPLDAFPVTRFIVAANIDPPWARLRFDQKALIKTHAESIAYDA